MEIKAFSEQVSDCTLWIAEKKKKKKNQNEDYSCVTDMKSNLYVIRLKELAPYTDLVNQNTDFKRQKQPKVKSPFFYIALPTILIVSKQLYCVKTENCVNNARGQ